MSEFVDETETLQANVEGMKNLSDSLATFNESFASWLYIMNMNALTTDWPQVCVSLGRCGPDAITRAGSYRCVIPPCKAEGR